MTIDRPTRARRSDVLTLLSAVGIGAGAAVSVAAQNPSSTPVFAVPPQATATGPLVLRGVTVIDVTDGTRRPEQTITVIGNRIYAAGPAGKVKVPAGARVVDARGKYLIPGLWDMHVHPNQGKVYSEWASWLFVANGVLGTRDAGSGVPLATFAQLKREIAAGTRIGPRLLVSGPQLNPQCNAHPMAICIGPGTPEQMRRVVDSLKTAGADMLKHYGVDAKLFYAAAQEARRLGIPLDGHPSPGVTPAAASDSGQRIIDHVPHLQGICNNTTVNWGVNNQGLDVLDPNASLEQCRALAATHRRNGAWTVMGPLGAYMGSWPTRMTDADVVARYAYLPPAFRPDSVPMPLKRRVIHPQAFALVQEADLPILQGGDFSPQSLESWQAWRKNPLYSVYPALPVVPGFSLHDELIITAEHGLTPLRALQAATLYSAQALGLADSLGTVAPGKVADLVLLDGDPLADIYNVQKIRAVVANGRYFDRAALDALLAAASRAS